MRQSKWSTCISWRRGPFQRANSSGSVWARKTLAGGASNSRVMRTSGTSGSTLISVSLVRVVMTVLLSGVVVGAGGDGFDVVGHGAQHVVEAAVPVLGLAAVALDPRRHQVEDLRLEVDRAALGVPAAADEAGVLEHPEVLGDGLDGDVVGLGQLVDGGVAVGQPGDDVPPGRVGERREHPGELICGHVVLLVQPIG